MNNAIEIVRKQNVIASVLKKIYITAISCKHQIYDHS